MRHLTEESMPNPVVPETPRESQDAAVETYDRTVEIAASKLAQSRSTARERAAFATEVVRSAAIDANDFIRRATRTRRA